MQHQQTFHDDLEPFLLRLDEEEGSERETEIPHRKPPSPPEHETEDGLEEIIDVYFVRRDAGREARGGVVESTLRQRPQRNMPIGAFVAMAANVLLTLGILVSFLYPPTVTVTLVSQSAQETLTSTLQLGRALAPITLSQSRTVQTTGHGHQDARAARGSITFYNGQFQNVAIAAGTILTGASGVQVVTDQDAVIPAESRTIPPTLGQVTVLAHALVPGAQGNIPPGDINQRCCASSILAQNTVSFQAGQDERNYQTVAKTDIQHAAAPMESTLAQSMQGAFQGQFAATEQLLLLPCTPRVTADHQIGTEVTQVQVTVSQTCSAVAYNHDTLLQRTAAILATQASQKLGTGYSLLGDVQVMVSHAAVTPQKNLVVLSFTCIGTWVYALSQASQQHIKILIAGKTKLQALHILLSMHGIERASIAWDDTKLPTDTHNIRVVLMYGI